MCPTIFDGAPEKEKRERDAGCTACFFYFLLAVYVTMATCSLCDASQRG